MSKALELADDLEKHWNTQAPLAVAAELRRLAAEVQQLTEERTAWRVTAENAEAAVKQARIDAQAQSCVPAVKATDQRVTFDTWLRSVCLQAPPDHAQDLARSAWYASDKQASADCEAMAEEIERLQKALAFWMPDVPSTDHPLYKRVANDVYLLVGFDGPNPEPSAFELGHVVLAASPQPQPVQPSERWHVGDSAFESWFSDYSPAGKGDKQRARDAYAAGMGELLQVAQAKPEQAAQPTQAACEQTTKKELPMLSISDEQAESIASEVYARNPVDGVDAAFKLDWELVRAGVSHAKALSTDDGCPHGNAHIVHDCLRCGAPVCCGKCCADDAANESNVAGEIAYQLTKKLVIDMPTARAAVDTAIAALPVSQPLTREQRRALIDAAGDKTDGLNQDDFADEIVRSVERHHGIAAPQPKD